MYRKCYNKCCKNGALLEAMPKMENCVSTAPVRTNQGSSPPENHTKNKTNSTCEPPRSGYCFLLKKSQKILEKCPHLEPFLEILMAKLMVQNVDRKWTGSGPEVDRRWTGSGPDVDHFVSNVDHFVSFVTIWASCPSSRKIKKENGHFFQN
jgi:hypothetical protein